MNDEFPVEIGTILKKYDGLGIIGSSWPSEDMPDSVKAKAHAAGVSTDSAKFTINGTGKSIYVVSSAHANLN